MAKREIEKIHKQLEELGLKEEDVKKEVIVVRILMKRVVGNKYSVSFVEAEEISKWFKRTLFNKAVTFPSGLKLHKVILIIEHGLNITLNYEERIYVERMMV